LEAALSNAKEARMVVYELFQDLDSFSLDDYRPLANIDESKRRLLDFTTMSLASDGGTIREVDTERFVVTDGSKQPEQQFTLDRDVAQAEENIELLGIDHPMVERYCEQWRQLSPVQIGAAASMSNATPSVLTLWAVQVFGGGTDVKRFVVPIAMDIEGKRVPSMEKQYERCFQAKPSAPSLDTAKRQELLSDHIEPCLQRDLEHRGVARGSSFSSELLSWVEVNVR